MCFSCSFWKPWCPAQGLGQQTEHPMNINSREEYMRRREHAGMQPVSGLRKMGTSRGDAVMLQGSSKTSQSPPTQSTPGAGRMETTGFARSLGCGLKGACAAVTDLAHFHFPSFLSHPSPHLCPLPARGESHTTPHASRQALRLGSLFNFT